MSDSIPISLEFGENLTSVEFPDEQVTVTLKLTPVGSRLYRICSIPMMIERVAFGDVIEADPRSDGSLRFVRAVEKGGWRTYYFLLPAELTESERITEVQNRVLSLGGYWERVLGGLLFLCLPPASDYDPTEDVRRNT